MATASDLLSPSTPAPHSPSSTEQRELLKYQWDLVTFPFKVYLWISVAFTITSNLPAVIPQVHVHSPLPTSSGLSSSYPHPIHSSSHTGLASNTSTCSHFRALACAASSARNTPCQLFKWLNTCPPFRSQRRWHLLREAALTTPCRVAHPSLSCFLTSLSHLLRSQRTSPCVPVLFVCSHVYLCLARTCG